MSSSSCVKTIKVTGTLEGNEMSLEDSIKGFFKAAADKINVSGYSEMATEIWSGIKKGLEQVAKTGVAKDVRVPSISGYSLATAGGNALKLDLYLTGTVLDEKTLINQVEDLLKKSGLSFEYVTERNSQE